VSRCATPSAPQRLSDEGITLLLVEQNVHRAMDFVARAYVIENGRAVLEGTRSLLLGGAEEKLGHVVR
jgi:branched-chain amino acid transport system ATP-binding protein